MMINNISFTIAGLWTYEGLWTHMCQIYEDHNTSHLSCGGEVIYTTIKFRRVSVTRQCVRDGSGRGWLGVVDTRLVQKSRPEFKTVNK